MASQENVPTPQKAAETLLENIKTLQKKIMTRQEEGYNIFSFKGYKQQAEALIPTLKSVNMEGLANKIKQAMTNLEYAYKITNYNSNNSNSGLSVYRNGEQISGGKSCKVRKTRKNRKVRKTRKSNLKR